MTCLSILLSIFLLLSPVALGNSRNDDLKKLLDRLDKKGWDKGVDRDGEAGNLAHRLANMINSNKIESVEDEAVRWVDETDEMMRVKYHILILADYNYENDLTDENEEKKNAVSAELDAWTAPVLAKAKKYLMEIDEFNNKTLQRALHRIVNGQEVPLADDADVNKRITELQGQLSSIYGKAKVTKGDKEYDLEPGLSDIISTSRDYDELMWAWKGWRDVTGPVMKDKFVEQVELMNQAAQDNGLNDVGQSWRMANFEDDDMEPLMDSLFEEIKPFYVQLHAYVRRKLAVTYPGRFDQTGPIPAHILGDMWGQQWTDLLDLVVPFPDAPTYDVTDEMIDQGYDAERMFKTAEHFFTSLGLEPMTDEFWEKTVMTRPEDRDLVCHASAWDFYTQSDFRIKMCTNVDMEYLQTIHHEMGHIEYFMQYRHQPYLYRNGANSGFHEAVGDTIALSVMTPQHLEAIGLIHSDTNRVAKEVTSGVTEAEVNFLMRMALEKVAFLPFGYMIDKYRWEIFRGNITPDRYNQAWWEYRNRYQGVAPPVERSDDDFDAGSKFHVATSVPYIRYFFSFISQFQFQEALCEAAGHSGHLHTCDIYQSTAAGDLLKSSLSLGASKPWRDVMQVFTGQRQISSHAILNYFKPLQDWLEKENEGYPTGW